MRLFITLTIKLVYVLRFLVLPACTCSFRQSRTGEGHPHTQEDAARREARDAKLGFSAYRGLPFAKGLSLDSLGFDFSGFEYVRLLCVCVCVCVCARCVCVYVCVLPGLPILPLLVALVLKAFGFLSNYRPPARKWIPRDNAWSQFNLVLGRFLV